MVSVESPALSGSAQPWAEGGAVARGGKRRGPGQGALRSPVQGPGLPEEVVSLQRLSAGDVELLEPE